MLQVPQPPESQFPSTRPPEGPSCASARCRGRDGFDADRCAGAAVGAGAADGAGPARLCHDCRLRVRRDLAGLPDLYEECESALGHSAYHLKERVSGSRSAGIPVNPAAVAARSQIMGLLASWAGLVLSERGLSGTPSRTVTGLAAFLATHVDWLAAHPAAGDFADEVDGAVRTARTAVRPAPTLHIELGTCVQPGCDSELYATGRAGGDRVSHQVRCGAGHVWSARDWLLVAHRLELSGRGAGAARRRRGADS